MIISQTFDTLLLEETRKNDVNWRFDRHFQWCIICRASYFDIESLTGNNDGESGQIRMTIDASPSVGRMIITTSK